MKILSGEIFMLDICTFSKVGKMPPNKNLSFLDNLIISLDGHIKFVRLTKKTSHITALRKFPIKYKAHQ